MTLYSNSERSADLSQSTPERFFARQPILDREKQLFGYEFLFRSGTENSLCISSPTESESATRRMVDNSVLYDFESLAGRGKAFLNCTRHALTSGFVTLLPARSTVLEILEDIEPDNEVLEACRRLRAQGYQFSLDDFVPRPGLERFLPYADYIKIDFRLSDCSKRAGIRRFLKGCDTRLIAEKVEEQAEFQVAVDEGFDLFQGYFFCRPDVLARNHIPSNYLSYVEILAAVTQPCFEWRSIERLVRRETSLCYRLLRVVNSANFALRHEISSIERALIVAGEEHFRKLVTVAIAAESGRGHSPNWCVRRCSAPVFVKWRPCTCRKIRRNNICLDCFRCFPSCWTFPCRGSSNCFPCAPPSRTRCWEKRTMSAAPWIVFRSTNRGSGSVSTAMEP